jgi:uncharacterized protein YqgV (UPF0045/DUF77 family)
MENYQINAAIQLLPLNASTSKFEVIDRAIAIIAASGLVYTVCPFETVVEGSFEEVVKLITQIKNNALSTDNDEIIINIKLHCHRYKNLFITDKTGAYQS